MSDFTPTPASEYPVVKTLEIELPSGANVRVRKPSVYLLNRIGAIPEDIRKAVAESGGELAQMSDTDKAAWTDFMTAAAFIDPKVSLTPKADHVCICDIPDEDRIAVMQAVGMVL